MFDMPGRLKIYEGTLHVKNDKKIIKECKGVEFNGGFFMFHNYIQKYRSHL